MILGGTTAAHSVAWPSLLVFNDKHIESLIVDLIGQGIGKLGVCWNSHVNVMTTLEKRFAEFTKNEEMGFDV